jgi:hypothetical protein
VSADAWEEDPDGSGALCCAPPPASVPSEVTPVTVLCPTFPPAPDAPWDEDAMSARVHPNSIQPEKNIGYYRCRHMFINDGFFMHENKGR